MPNYDEQVLGTQNPLQPANEITVLDDAVEQMTELEFAEYERNLYQDRARAFENKLKDVKAVIDLMDEDVSGWKSILLKTIG